MQEPRGIEWFADELSSAVTKAELLVFGPITVGHQKSRHRTAEVVKHVQQVDSGHVRKLDVDHPQPEGSFGGMLQCAAARGTEGQRNQATINQRSQVAVIGASSIDNRNV